MAVCVSPLPSALCELQADTCRSHVPLLCFIHDAAMTTGTHVLIVSFTRVSVACKSSTVPASKILFFEKLGWSSRIHTVSLR